MSATRDRIRRHVEATPGVHFSQVERDLELATGQVQYHLRRLVRGGSLVRTEVAGRTHYFPRQFDDPIDRRIIAFLRRETTRAIVLRLLADHPRSPSDLATELELARSTVYWHLETLEAHGIVHRSDDGSAVLVDPDRTEALVAEVSPSLPAAVLDRFIRTVDSLLDAREE